MNYFVSKLCWKCFITNRKKERKKVFAWAAARSHATFMEMTTCTKTCNFWAHCGIMSAHWAVYSVVLSINQINWTLTPNTSLIVGKPWSFVLVACARTSKHTSFACARPETPREWELAHILSIRVINRVCLNDGNRCVAIKLDCDLKLQV